MPANNSTTLCVTIVGVDRIFNCGHAEKRPLVGVKSKHLKKAFGLKYIHRRADDVNRKQIVNNKNFKKFVFKFLNTKTYFGFLFDIFWISHNIQANTLSNHCTVVASVTQPERLMDEVKQAQWAQSQPEGLLTGIWAPKGPLNFS